MPRHSAFRIICDATWDGLAPTTAAGVRHCDRCARAVHACDDLAEARRLAAAGWCIALAPRDTPPAQKFTGKTTTLGMIGHDGDGHPVVAWLVVLDGPMRNLTLRLGTDADTAIGSAPPADFVVPDATMAPVHARFRLSTYGCSVTTTAPILVNDREITNYELCDNDVLRIGATGFVFKSLS